MFLCVCTGTENIFQWAVGLFVLFVFVVVVCLIYICNFQGIVVSRMKF